MIASSRLASSILALLVGALLLALPAGPAGADCPPRTEIGVGSEPPDTFLVTLCYQRGGVGAEITETYFLIVPDPATTPAAPVAVLVLLVGGNGRIGLGDGDIGLLGTNFLLTQRFHFAAAGPFVTAVIDAASDFQSGAPGKPCSTGSGLRGCRLDADHMTDIANLMADLRAEFPGLPLWPVGTSRGTISAAGAAALLAPGPDGIVLTSTLTDDPDPNEDVFDAPLADIAVPVQLIAHEDDACPRTPPGDTPALAAALSGAPKVKAEKFFEGGATALSGPCDPLGPHGYFGIEPKVIAKIARFIAANP